MTMTEQIQNSPAAYLHRSSAWLVVDLRQRGVCATQDTELVA